MTKTRYRFARVGLAAVGVSIAGAALVPAFAAAAPVPAADQPLIETTCSFAQIDAAAHQVAPQWAARLDANPDRKAKVEAFFDKSVDERKATVQQFLDSHPQAAQRWNSTDHPRLDEARAKATEIANTCHSY